MTSAVRVPLLTLIAASLAALALLMVDGWNRDLLGQISIDRVRDTAVVCALATTFSLLLVWRRRLSPGWACAGIFATLQVMLVGVAPLAAMLWMVGAAVGIGISLVPKALPGRFWLALVCGLGILSAAIGWLLPFKLHFAPFYAFVLGCVIWWRRRELRTSAADLAAAWRSGTGGWVAFVAVLVVGLMSLTSWVPTVSSDEIGYHLGLPWELVTWHRYRMDVDSQVWALSAWAGDIVQAIAQLLAGQEARAAVNLLWLVVAMHLLHRVARNAGVSERGCWWVVALAASQPMTLSLGLTMQVELPSTAALLAMIVVTQSLPAIERVRHILLFAVLAGFAMALKVSNVIWIGLVSLWFLARAWPFSLRAGLPAIAVASLVGGSSYFYSALLTGNPVLPLFNTFFKSPYYLLEPVVNSLYVGNMSWDLPLRMLTDTVRYQESLKGGTAGFQLWLMLPAWLLALRERALRLLALITLVAAGVLLIQMQYLRYLYPILVLATVPMVGAVEALVSRRGAALAAGALVLANLAFLFNISWQLHTGPWRLLIRGHDDYTARFAPERLLIRQLRARGDDFHVFFGLVNDGAAELAGRGSSISWYDPEHYAVMAEVLRDDSGHKYEQMLRRAGATHVIVQEFAAHLAVLTALERIGHIESRVGLAGLYRLDPLRVPGVEAADVETPGMRTFWFAIEGSGPFVAKTHARIACMKKGQVVRVDWLWYDGSIGLGDRLDYGLCDAGGWIVFEQTLRMDSSTDRMRMRTQLGDGPTSATPGQVEAWMDVRRDLTSARDRGGEFGG